MPNDVARFIASILVLALSIVAMSIAVVGCIEAKARYEQNHCVLFPEDC